MWGGWTVHVEDVELTGVQIFYAYVADRADAVEAVRQHIGAVSAERFEARKPIQTTVFDAMGIDIGTVKLSP